MAGQVEIMLLELRANKINDLYSFLHGLSDASSVNVFSQIPLSVPSALTVSD